MQFGKKITKKYDENGNYNEIEENIVQGAVKSPISHTIEERVRVYSFEEELEEYRKFSEQIHADHDIIRPAFLITKSAIGEKNGYYYVIKCYTKLERFDEA